MLPALSLAAEPVEPYALPPVPADDDRCPCGSGRDFDACCARAEVGQRQLTRAAVHRWASARGVDAALAVVLREVTRTAPGSSAGVPRAIVTGYTVLDALAPPPELRCLDFQVPERLRLACWDFLRGEAALVREALARAPLGASPPGLGRPELPGLGLLQDRLLELRAEALTRASPRPTRALAHCRLEVDLEDRALVFEERRLILGAAFRGHPEFRLELARAPRSPLPMPECPCGTDVGCTHVLAAVDLALAWLADPLRVPALAALGEALATPEWSRALGALRSLPAPRAQAARPQVELAFVLATRDDGGLSLAPWLLGAGADGLPAARPASPLDLWDAPPRFTREDQMVLSAFGLGRRTWTGRSGRVVVGIERTDDLLFLSGHPRVHLDDPSTPPLSIRPGEAGLLVRPGRDGGAEVVPTIDGAAVPLELLARQVARAADGSTFAWVDRERRSCRVVSVDDPAALSIVLANLARVDGRFPAEAEEALLEQLEVLQALVPVTIAPELRAEELPPRAAHVVRLELQHRGLRVELLSSPLDGAKPQRPGEGPSRLLSLHDGRRRTTVRDLDAEPVAAEALALALGLPPDPLLPFSWRLEDDAEAFALVERLRAAAGEGVAVEWIGKPVRSGKGRWLKDLRVEVLDKNDWFGLGGTLEVDGIQVSMAAVLRGLREGRTVIRVGDDAWVQLSGELAGRLGPLLRAVTVSPAGHLEAGPGAAAVIADLEQDGARLDACRDFTDLCAGLRRAAALDPAVPEGFTGELRPYQREGFRWLARLSAWAAGGVLADDMGLGKTLQALALLCLRADLGPALVLAPTSVCSNWLGEARRFAPGLRLTLYRDADREGAIRALGRGDVLVASYGLLTTHAQHFEGVRFSTLVLDEAQAVKNAATRRAQVVRGLQADFTVALSGTPLENHLGELWSLYRIVFPRLLGSWEAFRRRYAELIEQCQDEPTRLALAATLRPFLLRRTKAEVAPELPSRTELVLPVVLSPPELRRYEEARLAIVAQLTESAASLPRNQQRIDLVAAITELRLLACHPRLRDPASTLTSAKLERFLELVPELTTGGHRTLVFSQFTRHLALVREALDASGARYLYLDGQTPPAERDDLVRRFQAGEGELFLISLRAGGSGLNLTGADYVVHLDPWWNPAVEDQATDRTHRIGQTRPVTVYRLVAQDTIEEEIRKLQARKRNLVDGVLEGMGAAGRLSLAELEALLRGETPGTPPAGSPRGG